MTTQQPLFDKSVVNNSTNNLHREWLAQEPEKVKDENGRLLGYAFGSKNFTKMKCFVNKVKLTNDAIDYWMSFGPKRQENENYEDYKIRIKFQKALLKYREYIYSFSNTIN